MDLSSIFSLRQKFTVIAITGRTGSGCTEVTQQLSRGFEENPEIFPFPDEFRLNHNSYRKYKIVYNYAKINFKPHYPIYYKHILTAFILKYSFDEFIEFLNSDILKEEFKKSQFKTKPNFTYEINELKKIEQDFLKFHIDAKTLINVAKKNQNDLADLYKFFNNEEFINFSEQFNAILKSKSLIKRNKTLQIISNNIRGSGYPYKLDKFELGNIFIIAEVINDLIKAIRDQNGENNTEIVIDSLRNPFEIMFFRQRYSAFYTIAVNREDEKRSRILKLRYNQVKNDDLSLLLEEEHSGGKRAEFYKQNVSSCIQNADIHITFKTKKEAEIANKYRDIFLGNIENDDLSAIEKGESLEKEELKSKLDYLIQSNRLLKKYLSERKESVSPYYSWGMQLLKYVSLIDHPGLVTPSPEERCMQIAFTAKYNSGCISRQVGAAITDDNFSIKAIGWNNTPEGLVPCSLRSAEDFINKKDLFAFTLFEKKDKEFKGALDKYYKNHIDRFKLDLKGQNVSFCFKTLINSYTEGRNQVHTRSLHAEESAFLQLSKYGGMGIQNGKLFTTASPCELCSKKAYQLGIKAIYYIDPYPGISKEQILYGGRKDKNPKIRLFNGAIGNAYHWLYEPVMPYKDELALILEHDIKDITKQYKEEIEKLKIENDKLRNQNKDLRTMLG